MSGHKAPEEVAAPALPPRERLEQRAMILSLLDALRQQSGDSDLGKSLERVIIERELREVEAATASDAEAEGPEPRDSHPSPAD